MFEIIDTPEEADKLHEAGLLWYKTDASDWVPDPPGFWTRNDQHAWSRLLANTYVHAILLEE